MIFKTLVYLFFLVYPCFCFRNLELAWKFVFFGEIDACFGGVMVARSTLVQPIQDFQVRISERISIFFLFLVFLSSKIIYISLTTISCQIYWFEKDQNDDLGNLLQFPRFLAVTVNCLSLQVTWVFKPLESSSHLSPQVTWVFKSLESSSHLSLRVRCVFDFLEWVFQSLEFSSL